MCVQIPAILFLLSLLVVPQHGGAQDILHITPTLTLHLDETFLADKKLSEEWKVNLEGRGSELILDYRASAPVDLWIAFPLQFPLMGQDEDLTFDFLQMLYARLPEAEENRSVSIDLTHSPAWSPFRKTHVLYFDGAVGTKISVRDMSLKTESGWKLLATAARHVSLGEEITSKTINRLMGYRIMNVPLPFLLGILLVAMSVVFLLRKNIDAILLASLCLLLLYDARFSWDLLRIRLQDVREWTEKGTYRHLEQTHNVADLLGDEHAGTIAVCDEGPNLYIKHLRYLLYPTVVRNADEVWGEATHGVFFFSAAADERTEGTMRCGKLLRRGKILQKFGDDVFVVRFLEPPEDEGSTAKL